MNYRLFQSLLARCCASKPKTLSIVRIMAKKSQIQPRSLIAESLKIPKLWTNCKTYRQAEHSWILRRCQEIILRQHPSAQLTPMGQFQHKPASRPYCPKRTRDREGLARSSSESWGIAEDTTFNGNASTPKKHRLKKSKLIKIWGRLATNTRLIRSSDRSETAKLKCTLPNSISGALNPKVLLNCSNI